MEKLKYIKQGNMRLSHLQKTNSCSGGQHRCSFYTLEFVGGSVRAAAIALIFLWFIYTK